MDLQSIPTRSEHVISRRGPDSVTVLLNTSAGSYFTLDEVGGRIWELCDGTTTVDSIAVQLTSEYEAERAQIEADILELLAELSSEGLVSV
ncbi:MAG: PqqD family protein [Gaiellaceae bacterium]